MRVALCFWGLCRSTDLVISSYHVNILQPLLQYGCEVDVFVHTYKLYRAYSNSRANESNILLKNTAYKLLKPVAAIVEDQDEADISLGFDSYRSCGDPWKEDGGEPWLTLDNHVRALWSLKQVTGLWQRSGVAYDAVIYLRPDVRFKTRLDIEWIETVRRGTVCIPDFHVYFGSNDRFAIGKPQDMALYGNRFDAALEYSRRRPLHAEAFLSDYMASRGIQLKQVPMRFQRVRANGVVCEADKEVF